MANVISNVLSEENEPAFSATARKAEEERRPAQSTSLLNTTEKIANSVGNVLSSSKVEIELIKPNFGKSMLLSI